MRTLNPYGHWHNRTQLLSRIGIVEDHTTSSVITYTQGPETKGLRVYNNASVLRMIKANKYGRVRLGHPDYLRVNDLVALVNIIAVRGKWRWG